MQDQRLVPLLARILGSAIFIDFGWAKVTMGAGIAGSMAKAGLPLPAAGGGDRGRHRGAWRRAAAVVRAAHPASRRGARPDCEADRADRFMARRALRLINFMKNMAMAPVIWRSQGWERARSASMPCCAAAAWSCGRDPALLVCPAGGRGGQGAGSRTELRPRREHVPAARRDDRRSASTARWQRFPDRPALVVRSQGVRLTWREFAAEVEAVAAGLLALGLEPGDRVGIWSPNNAEWVLTQFATAKAGLVLVNINPAYRLTELEYALNKVGCRALVTATRFKTSDYVGMLTTLLPELAIAAPGQLSAARAPALRSVIQIGEKTTPGCLAFAELAGLGGARQRERLASARRHAAIRRPDQHPVHLRHHRRAEGGDAHPSQHPQQRLLHRRARCASPSTTGCASRCRCITASAWCSACSRR